MAIEYTWTVSNTEFETTSGSKGIITLHWRCTAVDGEHSARSYGSCDGADMDFDSMTKENCIACVIDSGDQTEDDMKANLPEGIKMHDGFDLPKDMPLPKGTHFNKGFDILSSYRISFSLFLFLCVLSYIFFIYLNKNEN